MNKQVFKRITLLVILHLEGGYFHPDMLADGRVTDQRYKNSGETMFGIDRLAGGSLNTSKAGLKFWKIIDSLNARKNWKWNYKGGSHAAELKNLVVEILYDYYLKLSKQHLTAKAQKLVANDNRLLFHFIYSTWNGVGWFKKFAKKINKAVETGTTNKNKLVKIALDSRINSGNSLIKQGGNKIKVLFENGTIKNNNATKIVIVVVIISLAVFFGWKYRNEIKNLYQKLKIKIENEKTGKIIDR